MGQKMKKICFVTTIYGTYCAFLKSFATYLHETGEYDIYLICNEEDCIIDDIQDFVTYLPVKMDRGVSLSAFSSIRAITKIIKENKFDIVQYSTPNAAFYTSIAAKKAKVPVRLYCQWGIRYMGFEGWKRLLFKILEKITCDNSTYIEVESHNIRNFSLEEKLYTADRSCVIWNGSASGVNLKKFNASRNDEWRKEVRASLNINEDDVVFSFAARLTADKGINELLEAFLNLTKKHNNIKLIVMGGMDNEGSLNDNLMKESQASNNIVFTGNVPDVERYNGASDVFVSPSYREGFGLVVIEAEAMGIPAIVSNVPGQIDAIVPNETGLYCEVKSAKSLEEAMERLIIDADLRKTLGANAKKFVEENFEQTKLFSHLKEHRDQLVAGE